MGCQKKIAEKIISQQPDYILALKGNQQELHEQVKSEFSRQNLPQYSYLDKGHGRITQWSISIQNHLRFVESTKDWKSLKTIIKVQTKTTNTLSKKQTNQSRFYISSLNETEKTFYNLVRSHWQIENNLHWVLDVHFQEDLSRIRNDNSDQNFSLIRKIALNIIYKSKNKVNSINRMRLKSALDDSYRDILLEI